MDVDLIKNDWPSIKALDRIKRMIVNPQFDPTELAGFLVQQDTNLMEIMDLFGFLYRQHSYCTKEVIKAMYRWGTLSHAHRVKAVQTLSMMKDISPMIKSSTNSQIRLVALSQYSRIALDKEVYNQLCKWLSDSDETIRLMAARCCWRFIMLGDRSNRKMNDDLFTRLCDALNDGSKTVRENASFLLGTLEDVSEVLLHQTLSKTMLGTLDIAKRNVLTENASGDLEMQSEFFEITRSAMCGAFIHGLEDEFKSVRLATINSIRELSLTSESVAKKAIPYLIDMFNDEHPDLRLEAVLAIHRIGSKWGIQIQDDLLDSITMALQDTNKDVKISAFKMLGVLTFPSVTALERVLKSLVREIVKHNTELLEAVAKLGNTHGKIVEKYLVNKLLGIQPGYLPREGRLDDMQYISNLLLIFNACQVAGSIKEMLPQHVIGNYAYVASTYPDLVPDLSHVSPEMKKGKMSVNSDNVPQHVNRIISQQVLMLASDLKTQQDAYALWKRTEKARASMQEILDRSQSCRDKTWAPYFVYYLEALESLFQIFFKTTIMDLNGYNQILGKIENHIKILQSFLGLPKSVSFIEPMANMLQQLKAFRTGSPNLSQRDWKEFKIQAAFTLESIDRFPKYVKEPKAKILRCSELTYSRQIIQVEIELRNVNAPVGKLVIGSRLVEPESYSRPEPQVYVLKHRFMHEIPHDTQKVVSLSYVIGEHGFLFTTTIK
ncbi:armadillo-type protein [Gorgonomyces haynaldii]|nr:armadillo-type protein [Gorgonomyces haynaldii]